MTKNEVLIRVAVIMAAVFVFDSAAGAATRRQVSAPPAITLSGPRQKLNSEERDFLTKLSQNIKNESYREGIQSVIERLNSYTKLEQADYEFLTDLSHRIKNPQIAGILGQIAENHRPE